MGAELALLQQVPELADGSLFRYRLAKVERPDRRAILERLLDGRIGQLEILARAGWRVQPGIGDPVTGGLGGGDLGGGGPGCSYRIV